ncbi:hypothetical protein [Facklamia hominis]|uniref:Uncharacterized protein n=1 Tax=Facklamia hominis TaxID=178214 RepID=A0AAJ1Q786_9LACT|nr:hypothetical protein [Facklamia hominis]MDK7187948.1 hypothetical protein [Facklamia hominis]
MTKLEDLKVNIEEIKNEYIQKLEEIKAKIEELEDETDNRWKPKMGEDYWWVDAYGDVCGDRWSNFDFEKDIFNHTDVFPTEEEAYLDKERKQIRRELMKYSRTFVPGTINWAFNYDYQDKKIRYWNSIYSCDLFVIYFESQEMAEKAVEEVGEDRIKKYIFGVED